MQSLFSPAGGVTVALPCACRDKILLHLREPAILSDLLTHVVHARARSGDGGAAEMEMAMLSGRTVLIADSDGFAAGYLKAGLEAFGATVLGPAVCSGDALALLNDAPGVSAACVGDSVEQAELWRLVDELETRGTPVLLIAAVGGSVPAGRAHLPVLRWPFAAFQAVEALARMMRLPTSRGAVQLPNG